MNLIPRSTIWPGQLPLNKDGTRRPLLAPDRPYLTVHYTGAGSWLDPDDTPTELRSIQLYAQGAGKPWEYNYVIDGQGLVFEYAGDYRAAHYADHTTVPAVGKNDIAIGVLLLVGFVPPSSAGVLEQPTIPMIVAFRDLRAWLVATGRLADPHELRGHRQMTGAPTACPGDAVMAKWDQFAAPVPPPPTPDPGADMNALDKTITNSESGPYGPPLESKFFLADDGYRRHMSPDEWAARGSPVGVPCTNETLDRIPVR